MSLPPLVPDWHSDVSLLESFSHIRLLVMDLDGTFLKPSMSSLYPSLRELQRSLSSGRSRVAMTIATGRAWAGVSAILAELSLPKATPLVLYNGALVIENGSRRVLSQSTIPYNAVKTIIDSCSLYNASVMLYCYDDSITAAFGGRAPESVFTNDQNLMKDFNGIETQLLSDTTSLVDRCLAILVVVSDNLAPQLIAHLLAIADVSCTSSGSRYIEIRPRGVNKGEALRIVSRHMGISLEHVLTLGDADNDAEMLQIAGIGVSVRGASETAIRSSDYRCRHGAAEGAVELMRLVKHAKRFFGEGQ